MDEDGFEAHYDVVLSGTGLVQSILSAALSKSGKKVLHLDKNDFYGGDYHATHTLTQFLALCSKRKEGGRSGHGEQPTSTSTSVVRESKGQGKEEKEEKDEEEEAGGVNEGTVSDESECLEDLCAAFEKRGKALYICIYVYLLCCTSPLTRTT